MHYANLFTGELASALALSKIPLVNKFFKTPIKQLVGTAAASNLAPLVANYAGVSESGQNLIKAITLFGPAVFDAARLGKAATKLKNTAVKNAEGTTIAAKYLREPVEIFNVLEKAKPSTSRDNLMQALEDLYDTMAKGSAPAKNVIDVIDSLSIFATDPTTAENIIHTVNKAKSNFINALKTTRDKSIINPLMQSLDISAGINESTKVRDVVKKVTNTKGFPTISTVTLGLLGFGPGSYKAKALVGLGAAGAGLAAERVERMVRLMSHPGIRKHVADVLVAAAKRRIPLAANNLIKLDKVVKHVEKQD